MKKRFLGYYILLAVFFISCTEKEKPQTEEKVAFQLENNEPGSIQRMQVSRSEQDVSLKGKNYHVFIQRVPSDSLPKVKNNMGEIYADNRITLRITRDKGTEVFRKTFTKRSFSSLIAEDFLSKSVLEGMVYDKVSEEGLVFAVSVSFPQTDLYIPLSLTVSPGGKMSLKKDEILEEGYQPEG